MRRTFLAGLILMLLPLATVAVASGGTKEYRDQFSEVSYWGDDGDLHWSGPWVESESDGPAAGKVHIGDELCEGNKCLHLENGLLGPTELWAYRQADTSVFSDAELCFGLSAHGILGPLVGDVYVEVTTNGDGPWTQVYHKTMAQLAGGAVHPEIPIGEYLSDGFGVRFRVTGLLGGEAHVDNVEIMGALSQGTTTTTANVTTTTKAPTTTSSLDRATTTSGQNQTTSTSAPPTTSSTTRAVASTTSTSPRHDSTTTTTIADSTTTTNGQLVLTTPGGGPPEGSGIRVSKAGVQANFESGLHGGMDMMNAEVLGVELRPNFSMAVEVIEASWIWMIGLALIIATAIVTGLDRRRSVRGLQAT